MAQHLVQSVVPFLEVAGVDLLSAGGGLEHGSNVLGNFGVVDFDVAVEGEVPGEEGRTKDEDWKKLEKKKKGKRMAQEEKEKEEKYTLLNKCPENEGRNDGDSRSPSFRTNARRTQEDWGRFVLMRMCGCM